MDYQTPFKVCNGTILDANDREVRLFGVNYYAPFNHNFYNILELGKDHFQAIDEDFRHFAELDVKFIRIHLYDREITDSEGNLVENLNLDVFDYLLEKAEAQGIFIMLTPIVWWNTVSTQLAAEQDYAYWYTGSHPNFGFSNFYSKDSLIWHEDAIACQKRYFHTLFSHRGKRSGKQVCDYANIIAVEPFNEPDYIVPWLVDGDATPPDMGCKVFSQGKLRKQLKERFWSFASEHPELKETQEICDAFNARNLRNYFKQLFPIVEEYFGSRTLKASFVGFRGKVSPELDVLLKENGVEAISFGAYLNASGFDSANTDNVNHLPMAKRWMDEVLENCHSDLPRIIYEFDATASQNGYPVAALAAAFRNTRIQLAAYFTYTPAAVAQWNPGWLVHYLAMEHTPAKAAAFAAAAAIFHHAAKTGVTTSDEAWQGENFTIERANDLVTYADEKIFCYSNNTDMMPPAPEKLEKIAGRGRSPLASSSGNGCYILFKEQPKVWILHLHPAHKYLCDPQRGRQFRHMANRWISCIKEPPVSQITDAPLQFSFALADWESITAIEGRVCAVNTANSATLAPGIYRITLK